MISAVNPSSDPYGGLGGGYRTPQSGVPTGSAGAPPPFRGVPNVPGSAIGAPQILSSAARHNRGTNIQIPYARVCAASDLANVGRIEHGDAVFVSKYRISMMSQVGAEQQRQYTHSVSTAHADVMRVVGLDYINRHLGRQFFSPGQTVLVESKNPADDWRSLTFLQEWTLDGIVISNDGTGGVVSDASRADQVFNVAIQGPTQVNNGYEDDSGFGIDTNPGFYWQGKNAPMHYNSDKSRKGYGDALTRALVGGPFYHQYPLQMFDRKIKPLCDVYIGLVCKRIDKGDELNEILEERPGLLVNGGSPEWIHVFQFVPFSDRQTWQYMQDIEYIDYTSQGAYHARPNEPARNNRGSLHDGIDVANGFAHSRDNTEYMPRKRQKSDFDNDSFGGIKEVELHNMVGAWRIGKVMDTASSRKDNYGNGPADTSFRLTVNVDISFMDWRALRRRLVVPFIGQELSRGPSEKLEAWGQLNKDGEVNEDDHAILQWPTQYFYPKKGESKTIVNKKNMPKDIRIKLDADPKSLGPDRLDLLVSENKQYSEYRKRYIALAAQAGDSDNDDADVLVAPVAPFAASRAVQLQVAAAAAPAAAPVAVPVAAPAAAPVAAPAAAPVAAPAAAAPKPSSKAAAKPTAPKTVPSVEPLGSSAGKRVASAGSASSAASAIAPLGAEDASSKAPRRTGEDVLSNIFSKSSAAAPAEGSAERPQSDAGRNFPRRNRDR